MKHIHIVSPYQSAAMIRMTAPLTELLKNAYEVTCDGEVNAGADLNYHIPYHTLVGVEGGRHAFLYTHCNVGEEAKLIDACNRAERIVCMSFSGRQELIQAGVDPAKLWVIYAGTDLFKLKKRNIGLVAYTQPNGRKREHILLDLAWQMDLTPFHFVICGIGWQPVVEILKSMGVSVEVHEHLDWPDLQTIYSSLDMLLVTGYAEGGPLPLLEALACGTPVLAPPLGYAIDLLDQADIYNSVEELRQKLEQFAAPALERHQLMKLWSWKQYAEETALVLGRMLDDAVDLFTNSGVSRYAQILDVIDQIKPRSIVEIGTWTGERALQMIQEAAKFRPIGEIKYGGFDLFEDQTGEQLRREFSKRSAPVEVVRRRLKATGAQVGLLKGPSCITLQDAPDADLFFIDGGHSEETIRQDWEHVQLRMSYDSVVIFDDYYVGEHPEGIGCNQIVDSLDQAQFEVTWLPVQTETETLKIQMVKVKRAKLRLYGLTRTLTARDTPNQLIANGEMQDMSANNAPEATADLRELEWPATVGG